jgi:tripartite-type tricarboxylate transporter receptor subunit TctC
VSQVTLSENVIVAHPSVGATLTEVLAYAKANPGKLNYSTWGAVSTPAMYLSWINRQNGVEITPVPYKGAAPAVAATLANEVQLTFIALGYILPQIRAGKVKALAFTGSRRSGVLPDVPTLAEYRSDPDLVGFFGIFAPAGTPGPLQDRISAEFARALKQPRLAEVLQQQTQVPVGSTPREFAETVKYAKAQAAEVFRTLGIRPSDAPPS